MARSGARALLVAGALILLAGGCDREGKGSRDPPAGADEPAEGVRPAEGDLVWDGRPRVGVPRRLPRDRIVSGTVRNDSLRPVELAAKDVRVIDTDGKRLQASVVFLRSFVHGLYPPSRRPKRLPEEELRRTGQKALIQPGKTAPLTVSWRRRNGAAAVRLDFGTGALPIPRS